MGTACRGAGSVPPGQQSNYTVLPQRSEINVLLRIRIIVGGARAMASR